MRTTTLQTMPPARPITSTAKVAMLAAHAALPLSAERLAAVAAILSAWLPDADALSHEMSAPAHTDLMPITVLTPAHATEATEVGGAPLHGGRAP